MQAVRAQAEAAEQCTELGQALCQQGCALSDQGRWQEALAPLQQSLQLMDAAEHCDSLDIACVCNGALNLHASEVRGCYSACLP